MSKRKLTDAEEEAVMRDYYAWDRFNPESETAVELASRHGISKQTLYKIKEKYERKHGLDVRSRSLPPTMLDGDSPSTGAGDLTEVVRFLTEELVRARLEPVERVADAERQLALAEARIAELERELAARQQPAAQRRRRAAG